VPHNCLVAALCPRSVEPKQRSTELHTKTGGVTVCESTDGEDALTIGCPGCGNQVTMPAQACGGCGLRLVGPAAARLWQVDTTLAALSAERAYLLGELRQPATAAAAPSAGWRWPTEPSEPFEPTPYPRSDIEDPFAQTPTAARREFSPQQLLLSLGAALMLTASIVFVAVAWNDLGLIVQAVVMLGVTAGTTAASAVTVRRRLKATAESLGVVASGLVAIDCSAFWRLDALHVQHMSLAAYTAVSALVATLLLAAASRLIPDVKAFGVVSVLSAQVPVVSLVIAVASHGHELPVLLAAAVVGISGLDRALALRLPRLARITARGFAIGGWIAGATVATFTAISSDGMSPRIGMVVLAVAAISALPPLSRDVPPNLRVFVTATAVFAVVLDARLAAATIGGDVAMCVLGVIGGALIAVQSKVRMVDRWLLAAGVGTVVLNGRAIATAHAHSLSWIVIAAAGVGFLARGFRSPSDRRWAVPTGAASLALAVATAAAAWHASQTTVGGLLALAGALVLGAAALRRGQPEEFGLLGVAWAASIAGIVVVGAQIHQHDVPYLAGVLALTGGAWLMFSALPERAVFVTPALVTLAAAQTCQLAHAVVKPVEYVTLSLAVLLMAASRAHSGKARTGIAVAGIAFGILPSALVSAVDPGLARPIATAAIVIITLWFALQRANRALVATCAVAVSLIGSGLIHEQHFGVLAGVLSILSVLFAARASSGASFLNIEVPAAASLSTASIGSALAAAHLRADQSGVCVAALAALWALLALVWKGKREGRGLLTVSAVTAASAIGTGLANATSSLLSVTLLITGATWLMLAWRRSELGWTLVGIAALTTSWSLRLAILDVHMLEAYTVPVAVLLLGVGLAHLRRQPAASSWLVVGPALLVGLVPSTALALFDQHPARPMLVLVASGLATIVGLRLRWQALIAPAASCLCAVALAQLEPYAVGAPRWLTLAIVGVLLIATGARYERRLKDARSVRAWLVGLR
jgi:hypothetical protein